MKILILNQVFYPDVASTGQHASELALKLVREGHRVMVLTSRRGYDNPAVIFPKEETWNGVKILRAFCSGFGKSSRWRRAIDFASFFAACAWRLMWLPRFDIVLAMTSPPLISLLGALFVWLKRGALCLWMMDLNPDQAVAYGWIKRGSIIHRVGEQCLRLSLKNSARIIALDRFMRHRLETKGVSRGKITVLPPWAHDGVVYDEAGRHNFRQKHRIDGKFVVMYSGNHSPCHPLCTLIDAAHRLQLRGDIVFCFVGGGSEFERICRIGLSNVICLPYQPLESLSASLSAADMHVVVMGDPFVGIVHPCKIYNILRLGIPFIYIGPKESHVTDLLPPNSVGKWAHLFRHGDVEGVIRCILSQAHDSMRRSLEESSVGEQFSGHRIMDEITRLIEDVCYNSRKKEAK